MYLASIQASCRYVTWMWFIISILLHRGLVLIKLISRTVFYSYVLLLHLVDIHDKFLGKVNGLHIKVSDKSLGIPVGGGAGGAGGREGNCLVK